VFLARIATMLSNLFRKSINNVRIRSFSIVKAASSVSLSSLLLDHVPKFQNMLTNSTNSVIVATSDPLDDSLIKYNQDWTKKYYGKSHIVLKPSSTEEVSSILSYCNAHNISIVPQGGNTSLVGGATSLFETDVILSLERMNKILYHDEVGGILTCEAGTILEEIETFLHSKTKYTLPYDLGAKGSCQIGGNIATNAGGLRLVRYGNLHGLVLGLEVVLPNGQILRQNMLSVPSTSSTSSSSSEMIHTSLRKDNTGYDLKQLFIGSEGTLGIITKVSLHTPIKANSTNVVMLSLSSSITMKDIATIFYKARQQLGEILSAFEFWDSLSHQLVNYHKTTDKLKKYDFQFDEKEKTKYILIETMGSNEEHDKEKLLSFLDSQMSSSTNKDQDSLITDGVLAQNITELKELWSRRELITLSIASFPETITVLKYDLSLPQIYMYEPIIATKDRLNDWWNNEIATSTKKEDQQMFSSYHIPMVVGFGHFGDGNVHLNVLLRKKLSPIPVDDRTPSSQQQQMKKKEDHSYYLQSVSKALEPWIYEMIVEKWQGSISAEHGIGIQKTPYLKKIKSPIEYEIMKSIKKVFDPNNIMNRGKFFPDL
jgi:FAD/FMN-containing dehydrogenase